MLIGVALSASRVIDAVTDPLMGNLTDNTRTRWGRRRPWIALGAVMMAVFFVLMWWAPAGLSPTLTFGWFAVTSILFYLGFTAFIIPYSGLGLELVEDYTGRTRLQIFRLVPAFAAGMLTPWLYKLALLDVFAGTSLPTEVNGMRYVGLGAGVLILVCALAPAVWTKERFSGERGEKIRLFSALKLTFSDGAYLRVVGSAFFVFVGLYFVFPLMTYVGIYHVCGGDKSQYATISGTSGTIVAAAQFAVMPLLSWAAKYVEKKHILITGLSIAIVGYLSSIWLFTPSNPWLMAVPPIITNLGLCACWVVNGAFVADVCDNDELRSGQRREGMYSAVFGFIYKSAIGVVALLSSSLLTWVGIDSAKETVLPESLNHLRFAYALIPASFLAVAVVLMISYPLSRQKVNEIQVQLRARRAQN
jgi:Na+/melibiose symporter-like transporter